MSLLTVANLRHAFGTRVVLDGVGFSVEAGERVGLVGRNGCGKTTLMRAIAGLMSPDEGHFQQQRSARIGYLAQDPDLDPEETLRGEAESAFRELHDLHRQLDQVFAEMAEAEGDRLETLLRRQEGLERQMELAGGYAIDHRIDATLHGLGFQDAQFDLQVRDLSGGQRSRLALAKLLLEEPDLLLLDEPTNHLDLAGRIWLENFLADEFSGAVLMITHDRYMLDRVVSRILELEAGRTIDYPGNYSKFRKLREERMLTEARVYEKQQTYVRQQEAFIARYKTGQRAKQARGREARLERFKQDEMGERPLESATLRLRLPKAPRSGDIVFSAQGLSKGYEGKPLFDALDVKIERGERWGIIGPNGSGKTTLIRCLLGETEADGGQVRQGAQVSIGYYAQLHEDLDLDLTVSQYLQRTILKKAEAAGVTLDGTEQTARDLAGAFLFSGGDQEKELRLMSGGERSRAVLAGLVAGAHNLLVLDEPTNHLDIPSAERLEQVLSREGGYEGTLIIITHDRALLDSTCDHLIVLDGEGGARVFIGGYSAWKQAEQRAAAPEARPGGSRGKAERSNGKRQARKERAEARQQETDPLRRMGLRDLEQRIEAIQEKQGEIDVMMANPQNHRDADLLRQLISERSSLQEQLEPLEAEWLRRAEADD
ncbi:MAG: ABC-F family ATP-binding cassette domain-containing protein [Phycisphaerales bacterium JB038]